MHDLFGDAVTAPLVAQKTQVNAMQGFAEFWAAYPKTPRKVDKQRCINKWAKCELYDCSVHIVAHVEWLKTQLDWVKDGGAFICAPLVYLNQQRWVDWVAEPVKPKKATALEKIIAHKGAKPSSEVLAKLKAIKAK